MGQKDKILKDTPVFERGVRSVRSDTRVAQRDFSYRAIIIFVLLSYCPIRRCNPRGCAVSNWTNDWDTPCSLSYLPKN